MADCVGRGHINAGIHCYERLKEIYAQANTGATPIDVPAAISLGATAISNLSLGLEIFLKIHHFQTAGNYPSGHDIGNLVTTLPNHIQKHLSTIYTEMLKNPTVQSSSTLSINVNSDRLGQLDSWPSEAEDLTTAAALIGKAYVRWRYIYEELHSPFIGAIAFKPLLSMVFTLDFAIRNYRSTSFVSIEASEP